jgi:ubiquinone/menaquinone biosynthesis C-methylase UbiE
MHTTSHNRFRTLAPIYDPGLKLLGLPFGGERKLRTKILELLPLKSGDRVLEIGCGTGTVTMMAAERVGPEGEAIGIDPVPEMLERARRKGKTAGNVSFLDGAGAPLPFPDSSFDAIIFFLVLHEMDHRDRIDSLREAVRVLRPRGRLLVGDFDRTESAVGRLLMRGLLLVEEAEARDFLRRGLESVIAEGTGTALREERRVRLAAGILRGVCYIK